MPPRATDAWKIGRDVRPASTPDRFVTSTTMIVTAVHDGFWATNQAKATATGTAQMISGEDMPATVMAPSAARPATMSSAGAWVRACTTIRSTAVWNVSARGALTGMPCLWVP